MDSDSCDAWHCPTFEQGPDVEFRIGITSEVYAEVQVVILCITIQKVAIIFESIGKTSS